jgi:hypothetical protein
MPVRKSELYSSLWKSCDELRGGMDASQYKDYVLVLLFMKYVSDKAASQRGYLLDVPKGGSFADMVALKGQKDIGEKMNVIVDRLAEANDLRCSVAAGRIWLNLELAKKPVECLEYIIVHELMHLTERRHSTRFVALMDCYLPHWRQHRALLNEMPLAHDEWKH